MEHKPKMPEDILDIVLIRGSAMFIRPDELEIAEQLVKAELLIRADSLPEWQHGEFNSSYTYLSNDDRGRESLSYTFGFKKYKL